VVLGPYQVAEVSPQGAGIELIVLMQRAAHDATLHMPTQITTADPVLRGAFRVGERVKIVMEGVA
jgi:hypothetical protein